MKYLCALATKYNLLGCEGRAYFVKGEERKQ